MRGRGAPIVGTDRVPLSGGGHLEERLPRPAPGPTPRGRQERGPAPPATGRGPAARGRTAAGGGGTGGDAGPHAALAGQPHRPEPAVLPAGRGGDSRRQGAGPGRATRQRGELQPGQLSGRHPATALRPRCGTGTVARSRRHPGRGGGAVLTPAGRGGDDPGEGGRMGGGTV